MRSTRLFLGAASLLALTVQLTACHGGGSIPSTPGESGSVRTASSEVAGTNWGYYNGDLGSERFSSLTQITPSNAATLHKICSYTVPQVSKPNGFNFETGPIVVGGVMYFSTIDDTYAINASTCALVWHTNRPAPGGGLTNRGVAYGSGKIFRGTLDGNVVAMNATTGKILWDRHIANAPETITAAPIAWQGVVYIGTSGAENGAQCHVYAIDQNTGSVLWSYQTVPSDSSSPIPNWVDSTGNVPTHPAGGSTWSSYTLDDQDGILYVSVGNPGPDFDDRGRSGFNAYTDSVIALNASNGKLLSGYALTPHDVHDWDVAAAPVYTGEGGNQNGNSQGAQVFAGGKDGYVYSVDLGNKRIDWKTAITTVDAAPAVPIPGSAVSFCPGTTGGVEWNGPAYAPQMNAVFSNGVDICALNLTEETSFTPYIPNGGNCFGTGLWLGSNPCYSFGTASGNKSGWVTAMDASSGAVRWKYHSPTPMIAGVTATATGLVVTGDLNGNVLVFNGSSGNILKTIPTTEPIGGGVISYGANGKQYIGVAAGIASSLIWTPSQPTGPSSIMVFGL